MNARRASAQALTVVLEPTLRAEQISKLLTCRQSLPTKSLPEWLNQLGLTEEARAKAMTLLTDGTACTSLLIKANDGKKTEYRLNVLENVGQQDEVVRHFRW